MESEKSRVGSKLRSAGRMRERERERSRYGDNYVGNLLMAQKKSH